MNSKEINFGINFNVNKQNLNDLKQVLDQIILKAAQFEQSAPDFAAPYQEAAVAAKDLKAVLDSSWNSKLNQLDFSKVERQLANSYGSIRQFKDSLSLIGPEAQRAFGMFNSAILNTQAPLKQTNALLDKMAVTMGNTIRFGISSSIFNNLTSSVSKAYNYTVKLDKSLNDIRIVSGKSADQMEKFAKQANDAAKALGTTTLDYTDAALIYEQQGLSNADVAARTETTIKMSNALGRSAEEVSNYMTSIWNNFADGSKSLEYYADVITALGAATASSAEEIAGGLEKFASIGETVGLSYEYATAALTTITATTRQSEDIVGTALKTLFARIQDLELGETLEDGTSLGKYSDALSAVGISIKEQSGQLKEMDVILDELGSKWKTMSNAQQVALAQTVAGTRQYTQLIALMDNWDFFKQNVSVAQNAEGELDRQQAIYLDSVQAHLDKLEASWEGLYKTIFDEDLIKDVADILSVLVDGLNSFVTGWGGGLNNLIYPITLLGGFLSDYIAENLVRIKDNAEAAEKEMENLEVHQRLMADLTDVGSVSRMQSKGVDQVLKEYEITEKLVVAKRKLSKESQEQLAYLDRQLIALEEQENVYTNIVDKMSQKTNPETGETYEDNEQQDSKVYQQDYSDLRDQVLKEIAENNKLIQQIGQMSDDHSISKGGRRTLSKVSKNTQAEIKNLKTLLKQLEENEKKQGSLTRGEQKAKQAIEETLRAREREAKVLKAVIDNKAQLGKVDKNEITNALQGQNEKLIENAELYDKIIQELQKYKHISKETMESIRNDIENQKTSLESYRESLATQSDRIDAQAAALKGFFNAASSVSAIAGSLKTLFKPDTDLSIWERLQSVMMVIGAQSLNLVTYFARWKKDLPRIAELTLQNMTMDQAALMIKNGQTAELTKQVLLQGTLNVLQGIFNGLLGVAKFLFTSIPGLIVTAVAALAGLIYAYKNWWSEEARLNKELERTEENLKKSTEAYNELSSTVSSYKDAHDGIKGLTEGTVEFYEAIMKSNEEAKKLIEQLNLIAGQDYSFNAQGLITINDNVLERALADQLREMHLDQAANFNAKANYVRYGKDGIDDLLSNFSRDIASAIREKTGANVSVSNEIGEAILQGNDKKLDELIAETKNQTEVMKDPMEIAGLDTQLGRVGSKLENASAVPTDLTELVGDYKAEYEALAAEEKAYRLMVTQSNILAIGGELGRRYNSLPLSAKNVGTGHVNYVETQIKKEDWLKEQYDKTNGKDWDGNGKIKLDGQKYKTNWLKDLYIEEVLGWTWDAKNKNYVSEDGKSKKTKEELRKEVSNEQIKDAYETGALFTRTGLENFLDFYKTEKEYFKRDFIQENTDGTPKTDKDGNPILHNFNEDQRDLMAAGSTAAFTGTKFDYSVFTPEEMQAIWGRLNKYSPTNITPEADKVRKDVLANHMVDSDDPSKTTHVYNPEARFAAFSADYTNVLDQSAESLGTTTEALKLYGDTITGVNGELKQLSRSTGELVAQEYAFNKAYNEGVSTFEDASDAYDKWIKSVNSKGKIKISYDVADEVAKIKKSLEDILGSEVSSDFLNKYNKEIKKLFTGTEKEAEDAYKFLQDKLSEEAWDTLGNRIIKNAKQVAAATKGAIDVTIGEWQRLETVIRGMKIGDELGQDDLESLDKYITAAKMSQEELQAWLDANQLEVKTKEGEPAKLTEIEVDDVTIEKKHTMTGTNPLTGLEIENPIEWTTTETTKTTPYYTLGKDVVVTKKNVSNSTTNFSRSAANSGSGSKSKQVNKQDKLKDESDRYHDVDVELKQISNRLEAIQAKTDRKMGASWLENLNEQFALLNDQIAQTDAKLKIAKDELNELQGTLAKDGVKFDDDGAILNYFEVYQKKLAEVNAIVDKYNSFTDSEAQEKYQETMDNAIEEFNKFVENMGRVDEIVTDLIPGLEKDVQDAIDEQTALKIKAFSREIEVRLEVGRATRDWNEFKTKVIDGIDEDDILGNVTAKLKDFETYYNDTETGTIQRLSARLGSVMDELKLFDEAGNMNIYGDQQVAAVDDLKRYMDELQTEMQSLYDLTEEIKESYLDMMDEAQEKFDEQLATYQQISDLIDHDMNVIKLVYGETAYAELANFYDKQHDNNMAQLDFQKQQVDIWAEQMSMLEEGSDAWNKAKENWMAAVSEWTATIEQSIESIQNRFINSLDLIFDKLNKELTDNKGLAYLEQEWDLINKNADRYLDTINGVYAVQKLENKYQEAIDNNDGIKAQQQLKKIMDDELKTLREKDKLTQYDVDRAELRYQIALKQIALEEAQQNKSKMRLRRDSQGNYTYQYTADENAVASLENELSDLYQQLYNLDANTYKNNLNELYSVWAEFQQAMKEAALINDPEERAEREKLVQEQYGALINDIVEQNELLKVNLYESTMSSLADLYNSNSINYENMTKGQQEILDTFLSSEYNMTNTAYNNLFGLYDKNLEQFRTMTVEQKEILVNQMLPQWNSTLQGMADKIVEKGGFIPTCKTAFEEITAATKTYEEALKQIETTGGKSFTELKDGIDKTITSTQSLLTENEKLITSYKDQLAAVQAVIDKMQGLIDKYAAAKKAAEEYWLAAQKVWTDLKNKDADETQDAGLEDPDPPQTEPETNPEPQPEPEKPKEIKNGGFVTAGGAKIYSWPNTTGLAQYYANDPKYKVLDATTYPDWAQVRYHKLDSGVTGWFKKKDLTALRSGGYTGDWNSSDGRLALLHEKELVLNAQDTKNMLNAIKIVRTITDNLGAALLNKMGMISANTNNSILGSAAEALEQIVHIDAQFPNVTNSSEIEDALNNLVNRAAQHITKN